MCYLTVAFWSFIESCVFILRTPSAHQKEKKRPDVVAHTIILATQEAEARRIIVGGNPGQKVSEDPSQPISQVW
jgi:hypothetical protein